MAYFSVNHLLDYELDYELAIRSIVTHRNVNDKRKMLSKLLRKEKDANNPGSQIHFEEYDFDFRTEEAAINQSIVSITDLIIDFEGTNSDSAYLRIRSRLIHLTGRVNRLTVPEPDVQAVENFKKESYATCVLLESDLDDKVTPAPQTPNLNFVPQQAAPVVNLSPVLSCSSNKQPLSTWGVKFNGDSKFLYYFLERVSDLSQARGVTEDELFISAVELFVGDAFVWYRSVRTQVNDWNSLVVRLKKDFLPPYSDDEVWESIRHRKQKKNETITIFIAQLENLFNRLSTPAAEATKVKYIKRNLLPEYIQQLALHPVDSIATLANLCRNLEEAAYLTSKRSHNAHISYLDNSNTNLVQNSRSSSTSQTNHSNRNSNSHRKPNSSSQRQSVNFTSSSGSNSSSQLKQAVTSEQVSGKAQVVCFNCRLPNHMYSACTLKRKMFCFRCGEPNVRVSDCPKCSKN